ncbi:ribosome maturation factor RimP [Pelosinus sp. sgz500959]|uniref:ribosome maturation factor RimP n=1 Tax=Pelosinus sp. sgz500959 TaxID=3242472 RepID=UPI00366E850E
MSKEHIENLVEKLVQDIVTGSAIELVDVEYVKEREWYLRVFLDKEGGIEIEDCHWVSEQVEAKLEEIDPIKDSYYLEVSSPGLDRALRKDRDFVRHVGDKIEISTFKPINGEKKFVGVLKCLNDGNISIDIDGTEVNIPRDKTSQVRLYLDF